MDIERIKELLLGRPWVIAALGFMLGLIIGLPILGWWLLPVQWTDASPQHLRADLQQDYLRMVIDSYAKNQDTQLALQRWQELGPDAPQILATLQGDPQVSLEDWALFGNIVQVATTAVPQPLGSSLPTEMMVQTTTTPVAAAKETRGPSPMLLLGVFCLLTLIIGGALVYLLLFRGRGGGSVLPVIRPAEQVERERPMENVAYAAAQEPEAPVAQFMTTYLLGDDQYDDSFTIDSPSGEFLGECGVGISETVGVGDPKKVTAFEVWLFDKNDIQTVTKVLMSDFAYNDTAISQRLISKGEPVLVGPGKRILLETATLQLEAHIMDLGYGQGAHPASSFFERVTLQLSVWQK